MKRITIKIGDQIGLAELLEVIAPETCEEFCKLLPFEVDLHYAKIAGEEIMSLVPIVLPHEPNAIIKVNDIKTGSIVYFPERQFICIFYGKIQEEDAKTTIFAKITENLEGIKKGGEKVRVYQGKKVIKMKVKLVSD